MNFEKYAKEPILFDRHFEYSPQRIHFKPSGFWISVQGEDDWPSWVADNDFRTDEYSVKHTVELSLTNVLVLEDVKSIREFHAEFHDTEYPDMKFMDDMVNWQRVSETYDGIVIAPYQWSLRMNNEVFWYYSWDVASGCIWNLDRVLSVEVTM